MVGIAFADDECKKDDFIYQKIDQLKEQTPYVSKPVEFVGRKLEMFIGIMEELDEKSIPPVDRMRMVAVGDAESRKITIISFGLKEDCLIAKLTIQMELFYNIMNKMNKLEIQYSRKA